jgi:hypothetical protein
VCVVPATREHLERLEVAMMERERPSVGPLADPELWALDRRLKSGDARGVIEAVDAREIACGREPATIYLRARASLMTGREPPKVIAQRVAMLATTMSGFPELQLLVAEAWDAAGETRLAAPFAREVANNPRADDELRATAEAILRAPRVEIEMTAGRTFELGPDGDLLDAPRAGTRSDVPPPPAAVEIEIDDRESGPSIELDRPVPLRYPSPPQVRYPSPTEVRVAPSAKPPRQPSGPPPPSLTPPGLGPPSRPPGSGGERRSLTPPDRVASPLPPRHAGSASSPPRDPVGLPPPSRVPSISVTPQNVGAVPAPPDPARPASRPPRLDPLPHFDPPRDEEAPPTPRPGRLSQRPSASPTAGPNARILTSWPARTKAPREENVLPQEIEHTPLGSRTSTRYMRGASMPPQASEPPTGARPRPSVVPRVDIDEPDLIEALPMPRGASESLVTPQTAPRTPLEARARFTLDARELGRRYRREHGIELRVDARTIAAMQRHLAQRFPTRTVATPDDAREAEMHGALLSELLARTFDGEWIDITPTELGYWAMLLNTRAAGPKRVWPFGRVLRFIASGGEDDLVTFFRKLREIGP